MDGNHGRNDTEAALDGSLLRLSDTREIAIYQRDGIAWIADFRGASGELFTVGEWFALNGQGRALRRAEPATPLPARLLEAIERLHRAQDPVPLAVLLGSLRESLAGYPACLSRVIA